MPNRRIPRLPLVAAIGLALVLPATASASSRHGHLPSAHIHSASVRPAIRPTVIIRGASGFSWAAALAGAAAATGTLLLVASVGWTLGRRRLLRPL